MDDLDPLRRFGSDVPFEDPEAKERARQRLRQHFQRPEGQPAWPRRWRPRGRWIALAAGAVALIVVAQALLPGGAGGPIPSAAATLRRLARVASQQRPPVIPAGTYLYVRSEELRRVSGEDLETGASWTA